MIDADIKEKLYKLKKLIDELKNYRGRHTELVTVYVPAGGDLNVVRDQIGNEKGTAMNIKSASTRKNVQDALQKVVQELKNYKKTPENGMAIFCGNLGDENKQDMKIWVIEPPQPLFSRLYRCDQIFILDPLAIMLESDRVYGLIAMDNKTAAIGLLKGKFMSVEMEMESIVPGKYKTGGQSAARFSRVRENLIKNWHGKVAEAAKKVFEKEKNLKGIIVGGPGPAKDEFVEELHTDLRNKVLGILNIGYSDAFGLKSLVDASNDILKEEEVIKEKNLLKEFFTLLATRKTKVVYGKDATKTALEKGLCALLLVSESIDSKVIDELKEIANNFSTAFELISTETEEGIQFKQIGGVGAILRYDTG